MCVFMVFIDLFHVEVKDFLWSQGAFMQMICQLHQGGGGGDQRRAGRWMLQDQQQQQKKS